MIALTEDLNHVFLHLGNKSLNDVNCTFCGQCIQSCPTGALHEKETIDDVWAKLKEPDTIVIAQTAPAIRVALRRRIWNENWNKCNW